MTKAMQGTVNLVQSSARVFGMAAEHIIEHKKQFVQGMLSCPLSTLHKEYIQPLTMAGQMLGKAIHLACSDPIRLASGVAQRGMQAWTAVQENPEQCAALLLEMFATQRIAQVMNVGKLARALSKEIAVVRSAVEKVDEAKQAIIKPMQTMVKKGINAANQKGMAFENFLIKQLGGRGSFKLGGREFDGAIGNIWYEAKSDKYWDMLLSNEEKLSDFQNGMGSRLRIARDHGANYMLHSETPIPQTIKDWLSRKNIPFKEWI